MALTRIRLTAETEAGGCSARELLEEAGFDVSVVTSAPAAAATAEDARDEQLRLQRLATLGTMAAGTAHEITNLTAVVLSNLHAARRAISQLAETAAAGGHAPASSALDAAMDCCRGLHSLSREISHHGRVQAGQSRRVDIRDVLGSAMTMVAPQLQPGNTIDARLASDLPAIEGNRTKLIQVFVNLLLNAAQAVAGQPAGGGAIRVAACRDGARLRVDVFDAGVGIAPADLPRIFDPFYTTKESQDGVGLGLTVSREIVEGHGGDIQVVCSGGGTTVSVRLPVPGQGGG